MMTRRMTRQQRRASARQRRSRGPHLWVAGGIVAASVLILAVLLMGGDRRADRQAAVPEGVRTYPVASRFHTTGRVTYEQTPPVGGDHAPVWQNCGFYDQVIPNETAVHSLEHGAVWITYRPDLPADQVDILRTLGRRESFVLVSPFPDLPAPVVASAWGNQLTLPSAADPRLSQFISAFRRGPQTPEPGAPCTRGVGQPQ